MLLKVMARNAARLTLLVLLLTGAGWTEDLLAVQIKGKEKWPAQEADRLYLSACAVVQREYGAGRVVHPQITVVLGDGIDQADLDGRVIRLTKWDPYLFAQGVVSIALYNLLPLDQRLTMARRAVSWADATVAVKAISE